MNNVVKLTPKKSIKKTYPKYQMVYKVDFKTKTLLASYSLIDGKIASSVERRLEVKAS
jgi:hypothetical protein